MSISNFNKQEFLQHYWEQKPLLIKQAFPDFINPLSPEELAGLACEEEIESRLVTEENGDWQLNHGPLAETVFNTLPESHWTLLVQAVDHYVPAVEAILEDFRFIPSWRIDDVMVSYATKGGSVGPHYDNYSVFLLQGAGSRLWKVGPRYNSNSPRLPHETLRLLKDFSTEEEYLLEAGDMLYLPPQYGHWGIANDNECMTYSVGFRAPSHGDILSDFCDFQIEHLTEEQRFIDAGLTEQNNSGEISAEAIKQVQAVLQQQINKPQAIAKWFGQYMTQAKYPDFYSVQSDFSADMLINGLQQYDYCFRDSRTRIAFTLSDNNFYFFVDGSSSTLDTKNSQELATLICNAYKIESLALQRLIDEPQSFNLLLDLFTNGYLYFDDPDND